MDKKRKVLSVFLDLKKAFDTVSIPHLLSKMEELGIRGDPLHIFKDYLNERTQCVKIQNTISGELPITCGVPQGSVIGPTMFLIYVNQLCNLDLENGKIITFADDTVLTFSGETWNNVFEDAQKGLNTVVTWLKEHLLTLNTDKTKIVTFTLRDSTQPANSLKLTAHCCTLPSTPSCSCPQLERTQTFKYLGITLDDKLSFAYHIQVMTSRVRKMIFIFKTIRHIAPASIVKRIYLALCQSILAYCIPVWGGAPKTTMLKLERAQRAVLKVSTFRPLLFPTDILYKSCEVLTVRQLFVRGIIMLQHNNTPYVISTKRRKDRVCQPFRCNYSITQRFYCHLGPQLYNKLNKDLNIYPLSNQECKVKITNKLLGMNYQETESLLVNKR